MRLPDADGIPADLRDFLATGQPPNLARDQAEAGHAGAFFARLEDDLLAEADAEERAPGRDVLLEGLREAGPIQVTHRVHGRALAGHHQAVSPGYDGRIVRQRRRGADGFERFRNAPEV